MAVSALPTIRTQISGDGLTLLDQSDQFSLAEKLETVRYIKNTDGKVAIDFSFIDTVKTLFLQSTGTYIVEITTTAANVIPFEITGVFRLDFTPAFRATLSSITIETDSTTNITVNTRIYGV